MAIILYGGGFDPIHNGHLNMAKYASSQFDADVIFVPAPIAIWKHSSIAAKDKIEMIKLAIQGNPRFTIDLYEINSGNSTNYSIDTVKHFKELYKDEKIYYLIGSDQVNEFHRWRKPDELSSLAQIIYFERPHYHLSKANIEKYHMIKVNGECSKAASSDIRQIKSVDLPKPVLKYIEEHSLYYISKIRSFLTEERFAHSLEVAHLAYKIAEANGKDVEKAYIAGIFHDIGKDVPNSEKIYIMDKSFRKYKDLPAFSFHQFVGSYIANVEFEINDESILNAIKFHATGYGDMDWLAKIVYAADKIEPTRGYDSSELIKAMMDDYETGFVKVLEANKEFLETHRGSINNVLTSKCFETYLNK